MKVTNYALSDDIRRILPVRMMDALHEANIDFDDVPDMTLDDLAAVKGIGPSTLEEYAENANRLEEWSSHPLNKEGYIEVDGQRVPLGLIREYRKKRQVMADLGYFPDYTIEDSFTKRYWEQKKRFDEEVPDEIVARYILDVIAEREAKKLRAQNQEESVVVDERIEAQKQRHTQTSLERLRDDIISALASTYDFANSPVNDRMNIEHLADLMTRRAIYDTEIMGLLAKSQQNAFEPGDRDRYDWLNKAVDDIGKQIKSLEDQLQVSPKQRANLMGAMQAQDYVRELLEQTKTLRARLVSRVYESGVLLGWIMWHFPRHLPRCSQCGSGEFVVTGPRGKTVPVYFVTQANIDGYAEASDFVPYAIPEELKGDPNAPLDKSGRIAPTYRRAKDAVKKLKHGNSSKT